MTDRIRIEPVATARHLDQFLAFPYSVYADNPHWIPPLRQVMRHILDVRRNPFWQHAEGIRFLAFRDNRIVGRIGAQIDHAFNTHWHEHTGSFGFFECVDDVAVAQALFDAAATWLRAHGAQTMRGPLSPSTNAECGFLIDHFDEPPTVGMPYNPPYYATMAQACGFAVARELWSFRKPAALPMPAASMEVVDRMRSNPRFAVRRMTRRTVDADAALLVELYNACWAGNWGFSPITPDEARDVISLLKHIGQEETSLIGVVDGEPAGIYVALPDANQILHMSRGRIGLGFLWRWLWRRRYITRSRIAMLGIKPAYWNSGLVALLYHEADVFLRSHYHDIEFGWILDINTPIIQLAHMMGATRHKRFCIMERAV